MNAAEILDALRALTARERVDFLPLAPDKIVKPDNGEMLLAELPPNVGAALDFRRRHGLENRRELAISIAEQHLHCQDVGTVGRNVATLGLCRAVTELVREDLEFHKLTGSTKAFPEFRKLFCIKHVLLDQRPFGPCRKRSLRSRIHQTNNN